MKHLIHFWVVSVFLFTGHGFTTADAAPLPRDTPEAEGMSSSAVVSFIEEADEKIDALHSLMIVRHGKVIAEGWWSP